MCMHLDIMYSNISSTTESVFILTNQTLVIQQPLLSSCYVELSQYCCPCLETTDTFPFNEALHIYNPGACIETCLYRTISFVIMFVIFQTNT